MPKRIYLLRHVLRRSRAPREAVGLEVMGVVPDSYRGRVVVDINKCTGCSLCVRDCPAGSLALERLPDGGLRMRYDADTCASCGQCEASCRHGAIRLEARYEPASTSRDALHKEWVREGQKE